MNGKITEIHKTLAAALNALPGVFSTVQWGGRAYKLPGPGSRGRKKPVLLTHVCLAPERDAVCLGFRLEKGRARAVLRQYAWLKPHSFGTLKKCGWIETEVRTKAQCRVVAGLLRESRTLHPMPTAEDLGKSATAPKAQRSRRRHKVADAATDPAALRIEAVLRRKRDEGWAPVPAAAFED